MVSELIENAGEFWKHFIPNSLIRCGVRGEQGFPLTWASEFMDRVHSWKILSWPHSAMSQPEPHQEHRA